MVCDSCKNSLDGQEHIKLDGKILCASEGRKRELAETGSEHTLVREDGAEFLTNFESPRRA